MKLKLGDFELAERKADLRVIQLDTLVLPCLKSDLPLRFSSKPLPSKRDPLLNALLVQNGFYHLQLKKLRLI